MVLVYAGSDIDNIDYDGKVERFAHQRERKRATTRSYRKLGRNRAPRYRTNSQENVQSRIFLISSSSLGEITDIGRVLDQLKTFVGFEYNKRVTRLERTIVRADYRKSRILEDKQIEGECENIDPFPSLADIFIPVLPGNW